MSEQQVEIDAQLVIDELRQQLADAHLQIAILRVQVRQGAQHAAVAGVESQEPTAG